MYEKKLIKNKNTYSNIPLRPSIGLKITNASLAYKNNIVFKNLSADIVGAKWTCILGPSGVGKSTLLRMIAGLEEIKSSKTITTSDGSNPTHLISWMSQQDLLLPWLSVSENISLGNKLRKEPIDFSHIKSLLVDVGLDQRSDSLPGTLSGGQRQRVALARTLMEGRPVVLMDEPFSAIDAITRSRLQELASNLLKGRTVLQVTHDPLEALRLGHNIHILTGRPAHLGKVIHPPGDTPRDPTKPELRNLHLEILNQLSYAAEAASKDRIQ
jgi:putative hydroxymethylpyrimidine transport system ATP-binding protein